MKRTLIIAVVVIIFLLTSCCAQMSFRIPQNLTPGMIASDPAEFFNLVTMEEVNEILGSRVDEGVAALYQEGIKNVVVYIGFFHSTLKGRLFFEGIAFKNVFSIKKYTEGLSGGMMEIEKEAERLYVLWDRFFAVVIKGNKELSQKILEWYLSAFSND